MLIAHISDSHIALPAAEGSDRMGDLSRPIGYINALDEQPDLVVHSGDVTHNGTLAEYAESRTALDNLRAPYLVIPGNRDDRAALRAAFAHCLPDSCHDEFVQFSVRQDGWCVIFLDSVSTQSNKGRLCETRLAHFEKMVTDAGELPVVVFMHHPPFEVAVSTYPNQFEDWHDVDAFSGIVSRHRNVRRIYCGHTHRAAAGKVAGIVASSITSMAADLRMDSPETMQEVWPVYRLVEE